MVWVSYIMMAEPDHVFIKPLPNLATEDMPAAFPFFYIVPKNNEDVLRKFYPKDMGPITNIDPIGNSPVIIKKVRSVFLSFSAPASVSLECAVIRSVFCIHLFHIIQQVALVTPE